LPLTADILQTAAWIHEISLSQLRGVECLPVGTFRYAYRKLQLKFVPGVDTPLLATDTASLKMSGSFEHRHILLKTPNDRVERAVSGGPPARLHGPLQRTVKHRYPLAEQIQDLHDDGSRENNR
jgi:hypothetical protein